MHQRKQEEDNDGNLMAETHKHRLCDDKRQTKTIRVQRKSKICHYGTTPLLLLLDELNSCLLHLAKDQGSLFQFLLNFFGFE
jgi:hypothetical protein